MYTFLIWNCFSSDTERQINLVPSPSDDDVYPHATGEFKRS